MDKFSKWREPNSTSTASVWKEPSRFSGHGSVDVSPRKDRSRCPHTVSQAPLSYLSALTVGPRSGESRPAAHEHSGTSISSSMAIPVNPAMRRGSFRKGPFCRTTHHSSDYSGPSSTLDSRKRPASLPFQSLSCTTLAVHITRELASLFSLQWLAPNQHHHPQRQQCFSRFPS